MAPLSHPLRGRLQAVSLLVDLAEGLSLGAAHAGDVIPDLFAAGLDAFKEAFPAAATAAPGVPTGVADAYGGDQAAAVRKLPVFGRLSDTTLASPAGLQAAFGGADALARFMLPVGGTPPRAATC